MAGISSVSPVCLVHALWEGFLTVASPLTCASSTPEWSARLARREDMNSALDLDLGESRMDEPAPMILLQLLACPADWQGWETHEVESRSFILITNSRSVEASRQSEADHAAGRGRGQPTSGLAASEGGGEHVKESERELDSSGSGRSSSVEVIVMVVRVGRRRPARLASSLLCFACGWARGALPPLALRHLPIYHTTNLPFLPTTLPRLSSWPSGMSLPLSATSHGL